MAVQPYQQSLQNAIAVYHALDVLEPKIRTAAKMCIDAVAAGRKLLICGNGGSAAEAQNLAGELMGRYKDDRRPLPAMHALMDEIEAWLRARD